MESRLMNSPAARLVQLALVLALVGGFFLLDSNASGAAGDLVPGSSALLQPVPSAILAAPDFRMRSIVAAKAAGAPPRPAPSPTAPRGGKDAYSPGTTAARMLRGSPNLSAMAIG